LIEHDEHDDDRRDSDSASARQDNDKLLAKWNLPAKNPFHNDFDSAHPCTLNGPRTSPMAVAA
jgi:hypothetical protein